jgi:hypothetical protein
MADPFPISSFEARLAIARSPDSAELTILYARRDRALPGEVIPPAHARAEAP